MNVKNSLIVMISALLCVFSCEQTTSDSIKALTGEVLCRGASLELPRLTPRPITVTGVDELQVNLNGIWQFNPRPPEDFWKTNEPKGSMWSDIEVPGEWVMQGFRVAKETAAGYTRQFTVPAGWAGYRVKLRCDGVYSDAKVWVNGNKAGSHIGGFTPFELDITELIKSGQNNTIALAVKNESLADTLASGTYYAGHPLGGITRKIYVFAAPELNVSSLHVNTTFDKDYRDADLQVMIDVTNESQRDIEDVQVQFALTDPDNRAVSIKPSTVKLPAIKAGQTIKQTIDTAVMAPKKWDAEHPNLYVLSCQLRVADKKMEKVQQRFGFRQVEIHGRQLFVNNKAVKLHGICRHEVHPLRGRSLTPQLCRKDAELFRNANMNFIRTSHYPPSEEFLDACDELGIFVEDEAPFCWASRWNEDKKDSPEYFDIVVRQTLEMVQRDRSHPCIIIWSAANESPWSKNFEKSAEAIQKTDASRPRIFSWRQELDIISHHYPGIEIEDELSKFNVPVLFDEYMHLNSYNRREIVTDPGVREEWGRAFAQIWEKMDAANECLGGAIWSGIDDIFHLPAGHSTGYGSWGPVDGWRRTKPEYWHIKKAYSPIKVITRTINVPDEGEAIKLQLENRHDFTNLSEIQIEWALGDERGTVKSDIAPRKSGTISIRPKSTNIDGKKLLLKFISPRGFLIDSYLLPIGNYKEAVAKARTCTDDKVELIKETDNFTIKGSSFSYVIDCETGLIQSAVINGQTVLIGGPILMVLPLTGGTCEPTYREDMLPFNDTCSQWQVCNVTAEQTTEGVEIRVKGKYKEASGIYTLQINNSGDLTVLYKFTYDEQPKPFETMWNGAAEAHLRQMGIVFDIPKTFDSLSWERKALWTTYPEEHIGRPSGQARAFRDAMWPDIKAHSEPLWPWSLDSNALGTNDFRSTKRNIRWACLKDADGYGILVRSVGRQSTRSYLEGDRVRLLVAGYSTGGRDGVSFGHLRDEQKPLEKGTVLEDTVQVELLRP